MTRRIFPALLCLILVYTLFLPHMSAAAETLNKVRIPAADIKLYAEESVKSGSEFVVEIYIENITEKGGVIANDLPVTYDRARLVLLSAEPVFPKAWAGSGVFLGMDLKVYDPMSDDYPYWLRSIPDADDMIRNQAYRITKNREIGYKLRFRAVGTGEAFVAVENNFADNNPIMLVVIEGKDISNFGANGMTLKIDIAGEIASQPPPVVSGGDSSKEASSAEASAEASSEEASSEDVPEESSVESVVESAEISRADESADEGADEGGGSKRGVWIGVAVAVAAGAAAAYFVFRGRAKKE